MKLTKAQAITFHSMGIWKNWTDEQIVRFQLSQQRLCVDFTRFHQAMNNVLGRPIETIEFGLSYKDLIVEYLQKSNTRFPSDEEILSMLPEEILMYNSPRLNLWTLN